jgi:hypothetical protein
VDAALGQAHRDADADVGHQRASRHGAEHGHPDGRLERVAADAESLEGQQGGARAEHELGGVEEGLEGRDLAVEQHGERRSQQPGGHELGRP